MYYTLYPFLHTVSKTRPFEYLKLTSLGVIGAIVKVSLLYTLPILTYSQYDAVNLRLTSLGVIGALVKVSSLISSYTSSGLSQA